MDEYVRIPKTLLLDHLAAVDEFALDVGLHRDVESSAREVATSLRQMREEIKPL